MTRTRVLLLAFALIALGGASYGLKETVTHHYPAFEARFPHADQSWWNPALSWHNKYEGGIPAQGPDFPGSTTVFVFVTDAYHLFGAIDRWDTAIGFVLLTLALYNSKMMWPSVLGGFVVWSVGFHIIYTALF
jgi:hypothetical protein